MNTYEWAYHGARDAPLTFGATLPASQLDASLPMLAPGNLETCKFT